MKEMNMYTETMDYQAMEPATTESSVLPLTLTIIFCLIAGVALGIFMAKRAVNK